MPNALMVGWLEAINALQNTAVYFQESREVKHKLIMALRDAMWDGNPYHISDAITEAYYGMEYISEYEAENAWVKYREYYYDYEPW
jgi:hypothetical protein